MPRLSLSLADLDDAYDVVVVGSGYGGAIAASRLARAGRSVCVLERGAELQPGEYPDTLAEASAQVQVDAPAGRLGPATGLYDFRVNRDINVFLGCGLGGTSLVNANVSLEAEPRVMQDPCWPAEVRADLDTLVADGYRRASTMLGAAPYPTHAPALAKLAAHETSARRFAGAFYRPPLNVTYARGTNRAGVHQEACNGCGDCVSGCNVGAKNTVLMNYLPDARNFGAKIFTQASVRYLERRGNEWLVHFAAVDSHQERFTDATQTVRASVVVLAAGALGSTEILLRSRQKGLSVSDALGRRFTGNGDVLAFGYNSDVEINGVGFGNQAAAGRKPVGPCITSVLDLRDTPAIDQGMVVEEGSLPGVLAPILPLALAATARTLGRDTDTGIWDAIREGQRELESLTRGAYSGAIAGTQTYLVMAHDDASGRMVLEDDRLRIHWPGVGDQPVFERVNANLDKATAALGGTLVPNPIWSEMLQHRLVTVHPLGGCSMAASATTGVVDHKGRVFADTQGTAVHDGLYVSDGSVVPRSLGVNPLLTICALAERMCVLLAADRGWTIDFDKASVPPAPTPGSATIGVQFTETMRGAFSRASAADPEADLARGMQGGEPFEFTLTVVADDLDTMLASPGHDARMFGTVRAPSLSAEPLTVTDGHFQLFVVDPTEVDARRMTYRMLLTDGNGRQYRFEGYKRVRSDAGGADAWSDTTTLFITLRDGAGPGDAVLGRGILRIAPADFAVQLSTIRILRAASAAERVRALARFGRFFAGALFDTYGTIVARPSVFDPAAPPRQKRPLRTRSPEVHPVRTQDGVDLRLTRYSGGTKGPVMLVHGLGVSSRIFSTDTIETNLVEFLFANGYDVWNLDFRASIDLPASRTRFTGDDVAAHDHAAAIARIRDVTGAATVQAVVHCFGATTFFMSMLRGLAGVRSVVASQMGVHVKPPLATRLKTGLHTPEFLAALGVDELSAYVDANSGWQDRLFDAALRLYPVAFAELCSNPVCRRIAFLYGPLYRHAQLGQSIHENLHELFGVANIDAFKHLGLLCRTGHLVDARGGETYLTDANWHNLNLPIAFVHGAENECFLPRSTQLTFEELCRRFGPGKFTHHVIAGHGHIDCVFGRDAARDVFPLIVAHLDRTNA